MYSSEEPTKCYTVFVYVYFDHKVKRFVTELPFVRSCNPGAGCSKVDNAIQRINHYPVDGMAWFVNTYWGQNDMCG